MGKLVQGLFGGTPQEDAQTKQLQKQQLNDEKARQSSLQADEAAQRRALETGRVGRGLLTYAASSTAPKQEKLGA